MRDREPSTARRNAQLRQQIRDARCVHPYDSLRWLMLQSEAATLHDSRGTFKPCVQYCTDCMKIIRIHEK